MNEENKDLEKRVEILEKLHFYGFVILLSIVAIELAYKK